MPLQQLQIQCPKEQPTRYLKRPVPELQEPDKAYALRPKYGKSNVQRQPTKRPEEYTVGMILRLTEGSLAPVACVEDEDTCDKMNDCATVLVWKKMNEAINQVVDSITLADLVDYERQRAREYVI